MTATCATCATCANGPCGLPHDHVCHEHEPRECPECSRLRGELDGARLAKLRTEEALADAERLAEAALARRTRERDRAMGLVCLRGVKRLGVSVAGGIRVIDAIDDVRRIVQERAASASAVAQAVERAERDTASAREAWEAVGVERLRAERAEADLDARESDAVERIGRELAAAMTERDAAIERAERAEAALARRTRADMAEEDEEVVP